MLDSLRHWLWRVYFRPRSWEESGRVYEAVGVRPVKELLFGGRYFNAVVSAIRGRPYHPFRGPGWPRRWLRFTIVVEAGHFLIGIYMLALVFDAFAGGRGLTAARLFVINVLVNVYPVMVQRYNRTRLVRIFRL